MTMKTFSLVVLICLLVAVRPAAAAQPAEDSLLVRYRRMALDCDDDLRAAAKRIEASAELERAARAERIPTLSAGGDFRYTGNPLKYAAELPGVGPLTLEGRTGNTGLRPPWCSRSTRAGGSPGRSAWLNPRPA